MTVVGVTPRPRTPVGVASKGAPGKSILHGEGAPSALFGRAGEFYIDLGSYKFYGPKLVGNSWAGVEIVDLLAPSNLAYEARDAAIAAAEDAEASKTTAGSHATSAWVAMFATLQARDEALPAAAAAEAAASAAEGSATSAAASATTASTKAGEAATSATAAGNSQTAAATSATSAGNSATAASGSASAAAGSASSASTSAGNASTSATSAANSATAAGNSADAAAASAADAAASAATVGDIGTAAAADLDTDTTLAANSDSKVATQKAVKAYIDQIVAAQDAMVFKGIIDCSANPNYPAADAGHTYRVSVAGKIGGGSGLNVEAGDALICLADSTASGNQATVGSNWGIIQANIDGAVILTATQTLTNKTLASPIITGKLSTAASATGGAGVSIPAGAAPTSPVDGDVWTTTAGIYVRINGATVGPLVAVTKAAGSDVRAGADDAKFVTAKALADSAAIITLTDASTIAWDQSQGYNAKVTIAANRTFGAPTNPKEGQTYTLRVIQDGTGSRTGTWNACFDWGAAGAPTLSTGANKEDLITLQCTDASTPKYRAFFNKAA